MKGNILSLIFVRLHVNLDQIPRFPLYLPLKSKRKETRARFKSEMQQENNLGRYEYKFSKLVVSSRNTQTTTTAKTATALSHNQPAPDGVRSSAPEDRFNSLYKSFLDSVSLTIQSLQAQTSKSAISLSISILLSTPPGASIVSQGIAQIFFQYLCSILWSEKGSVFTGILSPEMSLSDWLAFMAPATERPH